MNDRLILRNELLAVGFNRYTGVFADDQKANNKLELGYETLRQYPEILNKVIGGVAEIAQQYEPQFIAGIPNGACGLAYEVANRLGIENINLKKGESREINFATAGDQNMIGYLGQGVLIEDVLNRRSTTSKALQIPELNDKVSAVIGVFDRSMANDRQRIVRPLHRLVRLAIPAMLEKDSPLWKYANK